MAPLGRPVPSPRARALRAGRGGPRGPGACRRRARGSSRHELEAVLDVANFPAARLDFVAQAVGFTEVATVTRQLPCQRKVLDIIRHVRLGTEGVEAKNLETTTQQIAAETSTPAVQNC